MVKPLFLDPTTGFHKQLVPTVITPSQITGDQDDYSPTGWADADVVRLSGDNGIRAITGLAAGLNGELKALVNVGGYPIYFPMDHPDSTAANRITGCGKDFLLMPGAAVRALCDGTSSRWRFLDPAAAVNLYEGKGVSYSASAASVSSGDWGDLNFTVVGSATNTGTAASSGYPASWQFSTGTSSSSGYTAYFTRVVVSFSLFGDAHLSTSTLLSIPTLSDGTETFTVQTAIMNTPQGSTLAQNNQIGIRYTHGTNSGKWQGFSRDNAGSESTVDLGITVSAATLYSLRIEYDKARAEARFYINGAFAGRVTGNMPNAVACGARVMMLKSAGTTARTLNVHNFAAQAIYP